MLERYTLGELLWVQTVGMFRDDLIQLFRDEAITVSACNEIIYSDAVRNKNILQLWNDYGSSFPEAIAFLIQDALKSYPDKWPHN